MCKNQMLFERKCDSNGRVLEEAYYEIASGNHSYNNLISKGLRNAIEILSSSSAIVKEGDHVVLSKTLQEIYSHISVSETFQLTKDLINSKPNIKGVEVGQALNDKYYRNWTTSSKLRYGNALMRWVRYLSSDKN